MAKAKKTQETQETLEFDFENHVFNGQFWQPIDFTPFDFENHIFNGQFWEKIEKSTEEKTEE